MRPDWKLDKNGKFDKIYTAEDMKLWSKYVKEKKDSVWIMKQMINKYFVDKRTAYAWLEKAAKLAVIN